MFDPIIVPCKLLTRFGIPVLLVYMENYFNKFTKWKITSNEIVGIHEI
jgi:hypothetical protein